MAGLIRLLPEVSFAQSLRAWRQGGSVSFPVYLVLRSRSRLHSSDVWPRRGGLRAIQAAASWACGAASPGPQSRTGCCGEVHTPRLHLQSAAL